MAWRVMTWNILGAKDPDIVAIATYIRAERPDVVALQEVRHSQAQELGVRLGWRVAWTRKHYPLTPLLWWRAEGQAILAPQQLIDARAYMLSDGASTWSYKHRVMVAATVVRGDDDLCVYNLHLSNSGVDERIEQAKRAADFITDEPSTSRVICGDLNAANELEVIREFHAVGVRDTGGDSTNPSQVPMQRLDYILVPENALVGTIETPIGGDEWAAISDHLPVLVEFSVEGFVPD